MHFDYFNVLVFAGVGFVFVIANMLIGSVIRPRRKTTDGLEVYECGEETIGDAWINFDVRYYTVALVYLIFAVEIAFLFPWALVMQGALKGEGPAADAGYFALVEGFVFIAILFLGLAYVWAKGDLNWTLAYDGDAYRPDDRTEARSQVPSLDQLEAENAPAQDSDGDRDGDGDDGDENDPDSEEEAA